MTAFSEESILLIEHYRTAEDIVAAIEGLGQELQTFLYSLESQVAALEWWDDGWVFVRYRDTQVYISNETWHTGDRYAVWVGIWNFIPGGLFGSATPPELYVWVTDKNSELLSTLVDNLNAADLDLPGEIYTRMTNSYAVRQAVMKYIGGDIDDYFTQLKEQIIGFFAFYAQWLWSIKETFRDCLQNVTEEP
jgi:hypothetical protein